MDCHIHHDENDEYDNAVLPCFGLLTFDVEQVTIENQYVCRHLRPQSIHT